MFVPEAAPGAPQEVSFEVGPQGPDRLRAAVDQDQPAGPLPVALQPGHELGGEQGDAAPHLAAGADHRGAAEYVFDLHVPFHPSSVFPKRRSVLARSGTRVNEGTGVGNSSVREGSGRTAEGGRRLKRRLRPGSNSSGYGEGSWYPSTSTSIFASTDFSPPMPTP